MVIVAAVFWGGVVGTMLAVLWIAWKASRER